MNPNYIWLKVDGSSSAVSYINFFVGLSILTESMEKVWYAGLKANELELADLLFCCLTVLEFSFTDKLWCKNFHENIKFWYWLLHSVKFAVADIESISWSSDSFDYLEILSQYKEIILTLISDWMNCDEDKVFDDFIADKEWGINVLLQYNLFYSSIFLCCYGCQDAAYSWQLPDIYLTHVWHLPDVPRSRWPTWSEQ